MRIEHLNVGALRPYGGALMDGVSPVAGPSMLACHCLLVEGAEGLLLVDTGTVSVDPGYDERYLDPAMRAVTRVRLEAREAAFNQLLARGYDPAEVRHVVMTHLDFDHAAGLRDFPRATVHVSQAEADAARHPAGPKARRRYYPAQWGDIGRWRRYAEFGADWFGLPAAEVVPGVMLVWLPGHTEGHCGVAVRKAEGGWLLHAGDAILNHRELALPPRTPSGARVFQWMLQASQVKRRRSLADLRRLVREHGDEVGGVCTHDPAQLP